jgi:hypothetical protein
MYQSWRAPGARYTKAHTMNEIGPGRRGEICPYCGDYIKADDHSTTHLVCQNTWHKGCLEKVIIDSRKGSSSVFNQVASCPSCRENIVLLSPMAVNINATFNAALMPCFLTGSVLLSAVEYRPSRQNKFSSSAKTSMLITVEVAGGSFERLWILWLAKPAAQNHRRNSKKEARNLQPVSLLSVAHSRSLKYCLM